MKFFYYLFLIITTSVFAQESFLEHKTDKGETAYSVAQKYNISLLELYKFNADIQEGVKKNQILKIPIYTKSSEITKKNSDTKTEISVVKTYTHTVGPNESLYSLAKMYNVSRESILAENKEILNGELKIGQNLVFLNPPVSNTSQNSIKKTPVYTYDDKDAVIHTVMPKETLYSLARTYNVSVEDIIDKNDELLKDGLQVDQHIKIPTKKKTVDGRVRVINESTIFHTVQPFETKYSISRLYGITIDQLEVQNPEIITLLKEGNKLAINKELIKPKNANEELMLVLAEKQVVVEKSKVKSIEIQTLRDRLKAQELMNQKVGTINKLNFDLNLIDLKNADVKSSEKLKAVLEANRKVQEVLRVKLDSLIYYMSKDLSNLKNLPVKNIEDVKKLEKASLENVAKTNEMSTNLKKELAENRKSYTDLMNKIETLVLTENQEYRKKIREGAATKSKEPAPAISMEEVVNYQNAHGENDILNELLISKVDALSEKKKDEVKKHISEVVLSDTKANLLEEKKPTILEDKKATKLVEEKKSTTVEDKKVKIIEEKKPTILEEKKSKPVEERKSTILEDKKITKVVEEKKPTVLEVKKTTKAVDDRLAKIKLEKYKEEAIEKRKNSSIKEVKTAPVSLTKVIEFLAKNPDFYKKEIASIKDITNLKKADNGLYIVSNDFVDPDARDTFIKKLYDDGEFNASFFFNENTSSYVVYLDKFSSFESFVGTLKQKENIPYYKKIKIYRLLNQENK